MKTPIRTLTVTSGRETLGFINEVGERQYAALLASSGEHLGLFKTAADAAQAVNKGHHAQGGAA